MASIVAYDDSDSEESTDDGSPCTANGRAVSQVMSSVPSDVTRYSRAPSTGQSFPPADSHTDIRSDNSDTSQMCHIFTNVASSVERTSPPSIAVRSYTNVASSVERTSPPSIAVRAYTNVEHTRPPPSIAVRPYTNMEHTSPPSSAVRPYTNMEHTRPPPSSAVRPYTNMEHTRPPPSTVRPYTNMEHMRPPPSIAVRPYTNMEHTSPPSSAVRPYTNMEHTRPPPSTVRPYTNMEHMRPPPSTVRPYIPKRLRQEHSNMEEVSNMEGGAGEEHPVQSARSIYRVSEYLGPHLSLKYAETEIPRSVVFLMGEHRGPVNRVQWCPVKQHSHLLLSASMDATLKVWDGVDSGTCLRTFSSHRLAVRDAQWSFCGQRILSGGFDCALHLTDVETGKNVFTADNEWRIGAVRIHPKDPNLCICAGSSPAVRAWDVRMSKVIHVYKASVQQHFDVLFLADGKEFLSTTDSVSRDSADRTIIAWDFATAAKISNQIFHERYTCPSLALHPSENAFIAQTNGDYIALFSSQRPYKMAKRKRYEGHKVEGFSVGCEFSPDGSLVVTGSSDGSVHFYNHRTSQRVRSLPGDGNACVSINCHPVLTSLLATAHWDGHIRVWQ